LDWLSGADTGPMAHSIQYISNPSATPSASKSVPQLDALTHAETFPGAVVERQNGLTTRITDITPSRLFSADGLSLPGADAGGTATQLSQFGAFVHRNGDLLSIIDQDQTLLNRALSQGFEDRSDLLQIGSDGVAAQLPSTSPITSRFLSETRGISGLLGLNLGGLRDKVANDETVAADLADGQTIQKAILRQVASAAADATGTSSTQKGDLGVDYFTDNPLAAAYLLANPSEARKIANDSSSSSAEAFQKRYALGKSVIQDDVAKRAYTLLDNTTAYPLSYLKADTNFSALLVGAAQLNENNDLGTYLKNRPELTLERVDVSELLRTYEVDKAAKHLPSDSPLDREFLSQNVGLALVLNRHEDARQDIVSDLPRLRELNQSVQGRVKLDNENDLFKTFVRTSQQGSYSFYF